MLNAEKYRSQILDIAQEGYCIAVSKDGQNVTRCCMSIKCENCIFDGEYNFGCTYPRMKWLLSEYKEPTSIQEVLNNCEVKEDV